MALQLWTLCSGKTQCLRSCIVELITHVSNFEHVQYVFVGRVAQLL